MKIGAQPQYLSHALPFQGIDCQKVGVGLEPSSLPTIDIFAYLN